MAENGDKHFIPLNIILPEDSEECQHCLERLLANLHVESALAHVHIIEQGETGLCIHFNPEETSVSHLEAICKLAGAKLTDQYGHANLHIEGMDCSDCGPIIEHMLMHMPGVISANVSYVMQQLVVEFDLEKTSLKKIQSKLAKFGFTATRKLAKPSAWRRFREIIISLTAGTLLLLSWLLSNRSPGVSNGLLFLSFAGAGYFTIRHSLHTILQKRLDIDVLMIIAAFGAGALGAWFEGALLLFLFSLGHALEHFAMDKARNAVKALGKLTPKTALVKRNNREVKIPIEQLNIEDVVLVKPGQRIPCDGLIIKGQSAIDQAPITGESIPVEKGPEDQVFAGTINGEGGLEISVNCLVEDSLLSRMVKMVLEATAQKSQTQRFTEKFAIYFVPFVLLSTIALIFLPPLFFGQSYASAFYRAMAFLVAASPCALAIGTPSAILSGVARAAQKGILVKGGMHLENLGMVSAIAFDKTGTLTVGKPKVQEIMSFVGDNDTLLAKAAALERMSDHPLAKAVVDAAEARDLTIADVQDVQSITGKGIQGKLDGDTIVIGSLQLFPDAPKQVTERVNAVQSLGCSVMIIKQGETYLGVIGLADEPRPEAKTMLTRLKALGITSRIMLTGDNKAVADNIAKQIGITEVIANLLPEQKVNGIAKLAESHHKIAMVGDGVNDAPAMTRATVGIAMGGAGTDVALEAADIALMKDDLSSLPFAVGLSRRARSTIIQNLTFAMSVVVLLIGSTLLDLVGIGIAVAIHEGSSLLVVLNSLRLLSYRHD